MCFDTTALNAGTKGGVCLRLQKEIGLELGGAVGLMLPLALAAAVRVPYTTSPGSDLGQVVNLSLSVA